MFKFLKKIKNLTWRGKKLRGLTLVELIVAISLFAVITLVSTRTFTKVTEIQDRTKDLQNIEGDLRYAMGVFSDELSYAILQTDTSCGGSGCNGKFYCITGTAPSQTLWLRDKNNVCVKYALSGTNLLVSRGGTSYAITSDDVSISALAFATSTAGDRVLVQLRATGSAEYNKSINYQTAITSTARR
jgi:prepilin-type N-terminal cleavage/methylation domain-containing protein